MKIARCIEVSGFILPVPVPGSALGALRKEEFAAGEQDMVPWPGPDHGAGLLEGRAIPIHLPDKHTLPAAAKPAQPLLSTTTQPQPGPPEEMEGTFKGEGGEYNSKHLPKASVSLCQVQADGHIH